MTFALIAVASFFAGALILLLAMRSRVSKAEANAAAERIRAADSEAARHRVEIEVAGMRPELVRIGQLQLDAENFSGQIVVLERKCASLEATIEERDKTLKQERAQIEQLTEQFKAQFALLSTEALKKNSEAFLATAKRELALQHQHAEGDLATRQNEIKQLLRPLEDGIKAYDDAVRAMEMARATAFGSLEQQLQQSVLQSAEVARQASALKDALKKPNIRGRWGEVQLENCIDLAGMSEHCDIEFQASSLTSENDRIRPDMIVRMPGGGKVAVDSKTPLEYFLQYIEATTEDDRNVALIRHARGVKGHVAHLAKTDYMQKVAGSPDFVIMFLPNESFLAMALEREPSLMEDALTKKVLIATPGTLIGLLKVIRYGWTEHRQTDSAKQIVEEGKKLNTEITRFLLDFAELGEALNKASESYNSSVRRVEKQITSRSQRLALLGAKSQKTLSAREARLLDTNESGEGEQEDAATEFNPMLEFGESRNGSLQLAAAGED